MGKKEFSCCFPVKVSDTQGAQSPSNILLFPYFLLMRFLLQTQMRIQALETLIRPPQRSQNLCETPTKKRDTHPFLCHSHSSSRSCQWQVLFLTGAISVPAQRYHHPADRRLFCSHSPVLSPAVAAPKLRHSKHLGGRDTGQEVGGSQVEELEKMYPPHPPIKLTARQLRSRY